ncbi:MAG: reductase [Pseudonocardiales bacterium]|jgi:FMN reductase|nr:reductase [Pseudonocardiales bacterium]
MVGDGVDAPLVVGIGGSMNATSTTQRLLDHALSLVRSRGARTLAFGGDELAALPAFVPEGLTPGATAAPLVGAVCAADAVIIATPGYHGGMSGLVKNGLDHLELLRDDVRPYLDGRAVGVIVAAAGWQACGTTLVSVRSAVHALRGWPTPFGVTVNSAEQRPDSGGGFDARVTGALEILATQVMDFVSWRAAAHRLD